MACYYQSNDTFPFQQNVHFEILLKAFSSLFLLKTWNFNGQSIFTLHNTYLSEYWLLKKKFPKDINTWYYLNYNSNFIDTIIRVMTYNTLMRALVNIVWKCMMTIKHRVRIINNTQSNNGRFLWDLRVITDSYNFNTEM